MSLSKKTPDVSNVAEVKEVKEKKDVEEKSDAHAKLIKIIKSLNKVDDDDMIIVFTDVNHEAVSLVQDEGHKVIGHCSKSIVFKD